MNYFYYFLSIILYSIVFIRVFTPQVMRKLLRKILKKEFNKNKFNLSKLPSNLNKEEFLQKIQKMNRADAKEFFFKAIGKTNKEIFYDKISTYCKNILKTQPIFYFLIFDINFVFLYSYNLFICFCLTKSLKRIFKRERPDETNSKSFPSGHCANASVGFFFTIQRINFIDHLSILGFNVYYNVIILLILFILWIFVLYSRLKFKRHYPSDIIAGVLIGIISSILNFGLHII